MFFNHPEPINLILFLNCAKELKCCSGLLVPLVHWSHIFPTVDAKADKWVNNNMHSNLFYTRKKIKCTIYLTLICIYAIKTWGNGCCDDAAGIE